jgi:uncharacterized protein
MRPKHVYDRSNGDKVSVWNYGVCAISWRPARSSITGAPRKGYEWPNPRSRAKFKTWKLRSGSSCSTALLRCRRQWNPELVFQLFQAVEGDPNAILELRDHGRRGLVILLRTDSFRLLRGEHLPTGAAAQPLQRVNSRRQRRLPDNPHQHLQLSLALDVAFPRTPGKGHRASGSAGPQSDLDLLISVGPTTTPRFPGGLVADLEQLLGGRVDILTENGLSPLIRDSVLNEAVSL